jgi:hypothetical protein
MDLRVLPETRRSIGFLANLRNASLGEIIDRLATSIVRTPAGTSADPLAGPIKLP